MSGEQNKYRAKRKKIIKYYLLIFFAAFLLGTAFFYLADETGISLFTQIGTCVLIIDAVCLLLIVPFIIYIVYLTKMSRTEIARTSDFKTVRGVYTPKYYVPVTKDYVGPWWSVIVLLFLLPPIGAIFIFLKVYREQHKRLTNSVVLYSVGSVAAGLGALIAVLILLLADDLRAAYFAPSALLLAFGAALLIGAAALRAKAAVTDRLFKLVWVKAELSIDAIASELKMSYGKAVGAIQKLIDDGFLNTCYIDFANRAIVAPVLLEKQAKKCRHCGGTTIFLKDTVCICDYCGRILK